MSNESSTATKNEAKLLKMLREAHESIQDEINAAADDEHPMMKSKIKMLARHRAALEKMVVKP